MAGTLWASPIPSALAAAPQTFSLHSASFATDLHVVPVHLGCARINVYCVPLSTLARARHTKIVHHWRADDVSTFTLEAADQEELQSLTPPFRLFPDQDLSGCDRAGSTITQGLDYYITHSATACAQACIAWNMAGRERTLCNAAVYKAALGEPDPDTFITSTGSSNTYTAWNCWLKVIKDICGPAPPPASVTAAGASMLIMDSDQFPCAPLSLPRS